MGKRGNVEFPGQRKKLREETVKKKAIIKTKKGEYKKGKRKSFKKKRRVNVRIIENQGKGGGAWR